MTTPQNTNGLSASCKGCRYGCGDCIENKRVLPAEPKPVVLKYEIADHETAFVRVGYGEKEDPNPVSECCGAPIQTMEGNAVASLKRMKERGHTFWMQCKKCNQPCDLSAGEGKISPASADSSPSLAVQTPLTGEEEAYNDIENILENLKPYYKYGFAMTKLVMHIRSLQAKNKELTDKLKTAQEALEKLSRLGNGDRLGNSDGNVIAQEALKSIRTPESAEQSGVRNSKRKSRHYGYIAVYESLINAANPKTGG